jgi:hypothetical protein
MNQIYLETYKLMHSSLRHVNIPTNIFFYLNELETPITISLLGVTHELSNGKYHHKGLVFLTQFLLDQFFKFLSAERAISYYC